MLRYISNNPIIRRSVRHSFRLSSLLPLRNIHNTSIDYKTTENVSQLSVDDFLLNESSSTQYEPNVSDKEKIASTETFILQLNSNTKIKAIEIHIEHLIEVKDFKSIWLISKLMKDFNIPPSYKLYILLLKVCKLTNKPESTSLATRLYYEAMKLHESKKQGYKLTQDIHNGLAYFLLGSFQCCQDFTELITLKMLWENYIITNVDKPIYELLYHSAYINTFLNTSQTQAAIYHFEKAFKELTQVDVVENYHQFTKYDVLLTLPTIRILDIMASNKDFQKLQEWLLIVNDEQHYKLTDESDDCKIILNDYNWLKYLNVGLLNNNYDLVKTVYDNFIMSGYDEGISTEDVLFRKDPTISSAYGNVILNSVNDKTIFQILHTFAINGDVNLTLALIESHYIHKTMKGEKALTKDLCLKIIESYCYHPDLQNNWSEDEIGLSKKPNDESVKRVLDVLNGFVMKFDSDKDNSISYRDITDAMSFKFLNYKVYDKNIRKAKHKELEISEKIRNPEDIDKIPGLPRKISNRNIESSFQGNVLANLETLSGFILDHLEYLREKSYSDSTIILFINCILNHTNLYQNFSGTVKALSTICKMFPNSVSDYLNDDLMNIILNSLANSNSAKISSLILFKYLHNKKRVTHNHYRCFISAILRGDFHDCLQFFLYNYLLDYGGVIDSRIQQMLQDLPSDITHSSASTSSLLTFITDKAKIKLSDKSLNYQVISPEEVDQFWKLNKIRHEEPFVGDKNIPHFKRVYNHYFDVRDANYLTYIFQLPAYDKISLQ
ncbi:uncharacterized protein AC631_04644 [Debaryomyces fabryi]|uniref:EF-hand domain-containing protein n=1 Tax=Debaryomyces fabryi TaxID=58627 RepID=A0A0V1PTN8_9ASCO|nr:uncharacterized protein AC631_04644 [Debaryomyces fabryi]KRZ99597.1 hypothetical protein AC631_04644 [Debaryomyces fabryi]CUM50544.1 unnamed protein product [Debaryomyces fabryi]